MNFVRDVVEGAAPEAVAVVERTHSGDRREHTFASLAERSARLAGTLQQVGVRRGDVVLLLIGNRIEWWSRCWPASGSVRLRSSAMTAAGVVTAIRWARSGARSCSLHGSAAAPMRKQASSDSTHSIRLPISSSTTSPRRTPT